MKSRVLTPLEQLRDFPQIARKVREGFPLYNIACWVQDECFEYEGAPREAVVTLLQAFQASVPAGEILGDESPHPLEKWVGGRSSALDVNGETGKLGRMVDRRIAMARDVERGTGMLIDGVRLDVRLKGDLLALPHKLEKNEKKAERTARRRRAQEQRDADKKARELHDERFPPIFDPDE